MIDAGERMDEALQEPACAIMPGVGQRCGRSKNEKNNKSRYSRTFHEHAPNCKCKNVRNARAHQPGNQQAGIRCRVWKYLRMAKQAAAAAKCFNVCPLKIEP